MHRNAPPSIPAPPPDLGNILEFMRVLWAVDHGLQSSSKRMKNRIGITGPQRLVVRMIGRFPGSSASELSETLHLHPSTLTGIFRRLCDRGVIARTADPRDGRRAQFVLTAAGKAIDRKSSGTVEAAVRLVLAKAPAHQITAATSLLRRLALELGQ